MPTPPASKQQTSENVKPPIYSLGAALYAASELCSAVAVLSVLACGTFLFVLCTLANSIPSHE